MLKNLQHERFCHEYLSDHNGTQAAIRAGYSADTAAQQASRLLRREDVRARVEEMEQNLCDELGLTSCWIVEKWMQIVNRCMQAEPVMQWNYQTHQMEETGEYTFNAKGANEALKHLAEFMGIKDGKSVTVESEGKEIRVTLCD